MVTAQLFRVVELMSVGSDRNAQTGALHKKASTGFTDAS